MPTSYKMNIILNTIWTFLMFTSSMNGIGQIDSTFAIYNIEGQLKTDSTIHLTDELLQTWLICEQQVLNLVLKDAQYSELAKDAGLTGRSVLAFKFNDSSLTDYRLMKRLGGGLDENMIRSLEKNAEQILSLLINACQTSNISNCCGTFYIPFEFTLSRQTDEPNRRDLIHVIGTESPLNGCK